MRPLIVGSLIGSAFTASLGFAGNLYNTKEEHPNAERR